MVPLEAADPTDAFGLLSTGLSRRIGAIEGPKARVLVGGWGCRAPLSTYPPARPPAAADSKLALSAPACTRCGPTALHSPHPTAAAVAACPTAPSAGVRPFQLGAG